VAGAVAQALMLLPLHLEVLLLDGEVLAPLDVESRGWICRNRCIAGCTSSFGLAYVLPPAT
jgi:hypothetical protein